MTWEAWSAPSENCKNFAMVSFAIVFLPAIFLVAIFMYRHTPDIYQQQFAD